MVSLQAESLTCKNQTVKILATLGVSQNEHVNLSIVAVLCSKDVR